jgi:hypothetical protein
MGSISIVHGIVALKDITRYKTVIQTLDRDENYPWIRPEMWNLCGEERPYYYDHAIASFAASYKNLDGGIEWSEFILKFEHFLRQLDFDFARIRLETEFTGDYEFFWEAKKNAARESFKQDQLIECKKWFFGFGRRHMFGGLMEDAPSQPMNFTYPVVFDPEILEKFNDILPELNALESGVKTYIEKSFSHPVFGNNHSHLILTYLKIRGLIRFGWDSTDGLYFVRLGFLDEIPSAPYFE